MTVGGSVGPGVATFQAAITNCQCNLSGYNILFYVQFFFADGCLVRRGGGEGGMKGGEEVYKTSD